MGLRIVRAGDNLAEAVNVVIEIPANSSPVKYEVDKESGTLFVDRFLNTAMYYPCNYGYIPQTLSKDGDPVDVLVVTSHQLICGSIIPARPVGILHMTDEKGDDAKVIAVPARTVTSLYDRIKEPKDLPISLLNTIHHFFEHYKDLEPGKWVKVDGWYGQAEALEEIQASIERYKQTA